MDRLARLMVVAVALMALAVTACAGESSSDLTIKIHHSRFGPEAVSVPVGVPITITLRNDDPIEHEWIVGSDEMHQRHRTGTEPYHDQVPNEVTVPALSSRVTTLIFDEAGEYAFVCHLPGHEAYGMRGTLIVSAP